MRNPAGIAGAQLSRPSTNRLNTRVICGFGLAFSGLPCAAFGGRALGQYADRALQGVIKARPAPLWLQAAEGTRKLVTIIREVLDYVHPVVKKYNRRLALLAQQ